MSWIKSLPWRTVRSLGFKARKLLASKDTPDRAYLTVDKDMESLNMLLRKEHFRSGWFMSYHYNGEDANLSRAEYEYGENGERQLHIRLFERDDGKVDLYAHYEACPIEHPRLHLRGEYQDVEIGRKMAAEILEKHNVEFERKEAQE